MGQFRVVLGFTGMILFGVAVLVWLVLVLPPLVLGAPITVNLGTLSFWTVVFLLAWRLGAGRGWGFAASGPPTTGR